jgi:hypothetical protein
LKIEPTSEETAAIVAALAVAMVDHKELEETDTLRRNRWRLAGLLGHQVPPGMKLEGSLWAYSSWEGMV